MNLLHLLSRQPDLVLGLIFLLENLLVTLLSLGVGWLLLKLSHEPRRKPSAAEYRLCLVTNLINSVITYVGFKLWQHHLVVFTFTASYSAVLDFILLFMAMDLAMYVFHFFIHHTFLYRLVHSLHHQYQHPSPIDLFVLHPFETVGFGALWLLLLSVYPFNWYAVVIYLAVNVLFGIVGHLGVEPLPAFVRNRAPLRWLGTSSFHHTHHADIHCNFGFYTTVWDKLFNTFKP